MAENITITANWLDGSLSNGMISRQYDNNRYRVQFINYPVGDDEELTLHLIVWMKTEENGQQVEQDPIELESDQWIITNFYTQFVQGIRFQLCVRNEEGTFEAHSPIFTASISNSLRHDGTHQDVYVNPLFDPYKDYVDELIIGSGATVIDSDLDTAGAAADAKATGDAITGLNGRLTQVEQGGGGLTADVRAALMDVVTHIAIWTDGHGQDYIDALETALYPPAELASISATYTQSGTVSDNQTLDSLKSNLVVTAHFSDGTTQTVTGYALSGTLSEGTSTITVTYGGKTTTFNVTVTHVEVIDYTRDALTGLEWETGYYDATTGEPVELAVEHRTPKFHTQDCTYIISCSDTSASYITLYKWDENGRFNGRWQISGRALGRAQFKPNCEYAIKIHHEGTFDPSTVSMMPVDKTATATAEFSIDLTEHLDDITLLNNGQPKYGGVIGQIIVTDIFTGMSIPTTNKEIVYDYINRVNWPGDFTSAGINGSLSYQLKDDFKIGFLLYNGKYYVQFSSNGITTLQDLKDYITNNHIVVTFNY